VRPAILIGVLAAVAIVVAVALHYGGGRLDSVVASTVERYGSAVTGTDVNVDGVDLALTAGRAHFTGLTIDNPKGYETDYAVRIGTATVLLDIGSLAGDVPVVKELELDGALINAEQRGAASNLTDIQKHATADTGDASAGEPGRIVVERDQGNDKAFFTWRKAVVDGKTDRRSISVTFHNDKGEEARRINFFNCFPVKWHGPSLNSHASGHATERVEIAFEEMKMG